MHANKLKCRQISFSRNTPFVCHIVVEICTENDSDTAVLSAKFQIILTIEQ